MSLRIRHLLSYIISTVILACIAVPAWSQSQSLFPSDQGGHSNYLQLTSAPDGGDNDQINVIFFEVPDTVTSTLYFAVNDPGVDATAPDSSGAPSNAFTDHYLVGGSGALGSSSSRLIDYSGNKPLARTGTTLSSFRADDTAAYNSGWYYFPVGVSPSQGEHIGNKYYFKIVSEIAEDLVPEITDVTCRADSGGDLDGSYFWVTSTIDFYYIWYDIPGGAGDPAPGGTGVQVSIATDDTAATVAAATAGRIERCSCRCRIFCFVQRFGSYCYKCRRRARY